MKKIFITFIVLCLFFTITHITSANQCPGNCRIKDNPSPWLERYFWDIDTIVSNISSQARNQATNTDNLSSTLRQERQRVIWSLNRTLNFWEYYCSFDFFVSLNMTNEIPSQVTRDSRRLEQTRDRINQILENTERRWAGWIIWEDVCNWVQNCPFSWNESLRDILTRLSQNNSLILQHFRASILEQPCAPSMDPILVPGNFLNELQLYYNKDTLTACSLCEDEFWWRTLERIQNISLINSDFRAGMQAWREAWAMLRWWFTPSWHPEDRERARDAWLESDWRNSNIVNIIHNNRERYDAGWLSTSSTDDNEAENMRTQITPRIPSFEESARQQMQWREAVPRTALTELESEITRTQTISETIWELYNSQIPYSLVEDTQSEEVLLRMIRMHVRLSESINLLERFRPRSERVCDRQWTGMWQCTYR